MILFNYFIHNPTDGFATVDSYTGITYEQIPTSFVSPTTGAKKELRDHVDFRPLKSSGSSGTLPTTFDDMPDADTAMTET